MALYSLIQFVSTVATYYIDVYFQNNAYYYIDGLLVLTLSFTMSFADAYPKLTVFQPTDRLLSLPILLSVFGLAAIQGFFQVMTLNYVQDASWYTPCTSLKDTGVACQENTVIRKHQRLSLIGILESVYDFYSAVCGCGLGCEHRKAFPSAIL